MSGKREFTYSYPNFCTHNQPPCIHYFPDLFLKIRDDTGRKCSLTNRTIQISVWKLFAAPQHPPQIFHLQEGYGYANNTVKLQRRLQLSALCLRWAVNTNEIVRLSVLATCSPPPAFCGRCHRSKCKYLIFENEPAVPSPRRWRTNPRLSGGIEEKMGAFSCAHGEITTDFKLKIDALSSILVADAKPQIEFPKP